MLRENYDQINITAGLLFVLTTFTATAYSKWLVWCGRQRALLTMMMMITYTASIGLALT